MLEKLPGYIAYTRKAIINVLGLLTSLLALGILPDPVSGWVAGAIAVLTVISHYITPNAEKPSDNGPDDDETDETEDEAPSEFLPAGLVTAGQVAADSQKDEPPSSSDSI